MEADFSAMIRLTKTEDTIRSSACALRSTEGNVTVLEFSMTDELDWRNREVILAMEATVSYRGTIFVSVSMGSEASVFRKTEEDENAWYAEERTKTIASVVRMFRHGSSKAPITRLTLTITRLDLSRTISGMKGMI